MPAPPSSTLTGIVVTAGRMLKAVKVRTTRPTYDRTIRKAFRVPTSHLVADPTNALRAGDVVRFAPWPASKRVRHVVTEIVAPWGSAIGERPPVLSEVERIEARRLKAEGKRERRAFRRGVEGEMMIESEGKEDGKVGEGVDMKAEVGEEVVELGRNSDSLEKRAS